MQITLIKIRSNLQKNKKEKKKNPCCGIYDLTGNHTNSLLVPGVPFGPSTPILLVS